MPQALVSLAKQGQIILHQPGVLADYLHLTCADPVLVLAGDNNPNYVRLKLGKMIISLENLTTIQT